MKLTINDIEKKIYKVEYHKVGEKTTVCVITTQNKFEVIGTSACVDPANYNKHLGQDLAYKKALEKVWELEGYLLQESAKKSYKVKTSTIEYYCSCGEIAYFTGNVFEKYDSDVGVLDKYQHKCPDCHKTYLLEQEYPFTIEQQEVITDD